MPKQEGGRRRELNFECLQQWGSEDGELSALRVPNINMESPLWERLQVVEAEWRMSGTRDSKMTSVSAWTNVKLEITGDFQRAGYAVLSACVCMLF